MTLFTTLSSSYYKNILFFVLTFKFYFFLIGVTGVASVGLKRLKKIVREKIEQRCRAPGSGSMASVNPHVLKSMFKRFDTSGDGALDRNGKSTKKTKKQKTKNKKQKQKKRKKRKKRTKNIF